MNESDVSRAVGAALSIASSAGLEVHRSTVLLNSNRLTVRLRPADVVARISGPVPRRGAQLEVEFAQRLAGTDAPITALDPRVEARVHERDGFAISLWTYYPSIMSGPSPTEYADALVRLHIGTRQLKFPAPHFLDRVADTQQWVANRDITPELTDADRELLVTTLDGLRLSMDTGGAAEQLLHGEPHPGNLLNTSSGPLFIDFEDCVRGPVEYDLAWTPERVSEHYPSANQELLGQCRGLILAIIAAHRWRHDDQHPSGQQSGAAFTSALREGAPWPAHDVV